MDPVQAVWKADGCPDLDDTTEVGTCSITGLVGPSVPARSVVSSNFGDWDRIHTPPSTARFGAAAVHAFRTWGPIRATESRWRDTELLATVIKRDGITDLRRGDPLPRPGSTMVCPITRQGHILPYLQWGQWGTEHGARTVTARSWNRVRLLAELRAAGLGEAEATEPTPRPNAPDRFGLTLPALIDTWQALAQLRADPLLLAIALRITRQPQETQ